MSYLGAQVFAKDAPERILNMCTFNSSDESLMERLSTMNQMAQMGFRVIALAEGHLSSSAVENKTPFEPSELEFLEFVGMMDPCRVWPGCYKCYAG